MPVAAAAVTALLESGTVAASIANLSCVATAVVIAVAVVVFSLMLVLLCPLLLLLLLLLLQLHHTGSALALCNGSQLPKLGAGEEAWLGC